MRLIVIFLSIALAALAASCVSTGTYDAVAFSRDSLKSVSDSLRTEIKARDAKIKNLIFDVETLKDELSDLKAKLSDLRSNYETLKKSSSSTARELTKTVEKLQTALFDKRKEIKNLKRKLETIQAKLDAREKAIENLRKTLQDALYGFAEKGMTVSIKNGKVYVSLSNRLLFGSGSVEINKKGKEALLELAKALNANPDINILVEGHTDDKPVRSGARFKDNWDLSVLRATEVVRFLTEKGGVDPKRIIASGRGEYFPIDTSGSEEARARNRRTEIILTPKIEELFEIINKK